MNGCNGLEEAPEGPATDGSLDADLTSSISGSCSKICLEFLSFLKQTLAFLRM